MHDLQKKDLQLMIGKLNVFGCQYLIVTPEGERFGGLEAVEKKHTLRAPRKDYSAYDISARIEAMVPGETIDFVPTGNGDGVSAENLRANVCSAACARFGRGNAQTTVVDNTVVLYRVA